MYNLSIRYGQTEPEEDGTVLMCASEDCKDEADVLASVEYWLDQKGVSNISISKTDDIE